MHVAIWVTLIIAYHYSVCAIICFGGILLHWSDILSITHRSISKQAIQTFKIWEAKIQLLCSLQRECHAAIMCTMYICLAIVYFQPFKAYMYMVYHESLHHYDQMYKPSLVPSLLVML